MSFIAKFYLTKMFRKDKALAIEGDHLRVTWQNVISPIKNKDVPDEIWKFFELTGDDNTVILNATTMDAWKKAKVTWKGKTYTLDELRRGVHVAHDVVIERAIEVGETVEITAEVVDVGRRATGATQTLLLHARDVAGGTVWRTTHTSLFLGVELLGAPGCAGPPIRPSAARSSDGGAENVIAERHSFIRPVDAHVYSECARIWNPIHTDVAIANRLGLDAPILHGTATLARAVSIVTELADVPLAAVRRVACRFGAVVGLGADIRVRLLDTSSSRLGFEVRNARGERAVRDGLIAFGP